MAGADAARDGLLRGFDALSAHVALLDGRGRIRWVNEAWRRFGEENGGDPRAIGPGSDYGALDLATLPPADASDSYDALRRVLDRRSPRETLEYPCHAPDRERWFRALFERIADRGEMQVIAVHENVTDTVVAARRARETAQLTRRLQTSLLGRPSGSERYDVATFYRPGDSRLLLGGDFLDVHESADGALAAVIGDVSGHGPEAAALGATLRAAWRTLALPGTSPPVVLERLDAVLRSERANREVFATIAGVWIAADGESGTCALAGHPPPLLVGRDPAEPLAAPVNPPLGCLERPPRVARFALTPERSLLLYTDGLTDARARPGGGDRLGVRGLGSLAAFRDLRAEVALERLVAEVMAMGAEGLGDDAALVAITRNGPPRAS